MSASLSDKERALLLEALSRHAVHVRECIDTCARDVPGLPPTTPGVLAAYREDLALTDRLYAKIQAAAETQKSPQIDASTINASTITDAQCQAVVALMPFQRDLLDGALGFVEPHRNHSRHELAKLWNALACPNCTLQYLGGANHPTGCIFVGWGHGWQPCQTCGGSGLSPMGNALHANGGSGGLA